MIVQCVPKNETRIILNILLQPVAMKFSM